MSVMISLAGVASKLKPTAPDSAMQVAGWPGVVSNATVLSKRARTTFFESRFLLCRTCVLRSRFHISLYRWLKQRVLVTESRIDARGVETHRLDKIGHGCSLVPAFPKKHDRRLQGRIPIEADRSSSLASPCFHVLLTTGMSYLEIVHPTRL